MIAQWAAPLLLAVAALAACAPGVGSALPKRPVAEQFPRAVGQPLTITLSPGSAVTLQPGEAKPGPRVLCTLMISEPGRADQQLVTIGEDDTEALTCGRLKEAGAVPASPPMQRIALLYEAYGPHAKVLQPVILYRGTAEQAWRTDPDLAQRIGEDGSLHNIAAIRRWLTTK